MKFYTKCWGVQFSEEKGMQCVSIPELILYEDAKESEIPDLISAR